MNTSAPLTATPQPTGASSTTPAMRTGTRVVTRDGRTLVYAKAGAAPLVAGNLVQSPAQVALLQNLAVTATPAGAFVINITPGAVTAAANAFAGGWVIVSTAPGLGQQLSIGSHPAIASTTAFDLVLAADDPVQVALSTASKVDLVANPYEGVIQCPTALTAAPVGVALYPIGANEYGWVQVSGVGAVLIDGTPAVGQALSPSGSVAGAAAINAATAAIVGVALVTGVGGRVQPVRLTLG